jgi:hypothetical protein
MLRAFADRHIEPDLLVGTSAGAQRRLHRRPRDGPAWRRRPGARLGRAACALGVRP